MIKIFGHLSRASRILIYTWSAVYGNSGYMEMHEAIGRKALLHWLNNPTKALVNDLFITPIMFGLLTMMVHARVKLTHPDITLIVNFIEITRKSSLIAYLHAQLVSQSVSFMMTRGLRIMYVFDKTLRYTYSHMLEIIAFIRIIANWNFDHEKQFRSWYESFLARAINLFRIIFKFHFSRRFTRWKKVVVVLNVYIITFAFCNGIG